jgi:plastocyanin
LVVIRLEVKVVRYRRFAFGLSAVAVALISGCGNGPPSTANSGGPAVDVGTAGAKLGTPDVKVEANDNLVFSPTSTSAKVGQIVQWTNAGSTTHNITFNGDAVGVSDTTFNGGDVWQVKFTKAGTYSYQCTIHSGMNGTITVS